MQETTLTAQEMLAEILGKPAPRTKIEEIELACLALMGDESIRPIDKPDIYCARNKRGQGRIFDSRRRGCLIGASKASPFANAVEIGTCGQRWRSLCRDRLRLAVRS